MSSAAISSLKDSRTTALAAMAEQQNELAILNGKVRALNNEISRRQQQITEIEAAITTLGGTVEE